MLNSNINKNRHRGIAGLISIIAILFVFSFATIALLQVEAKQVSLVNSISEKIIIQSLSASEKLSPLFVSCNEIIPGIFTAFFLIDNIGEENSNLDSVLFLQKQDNIIQNVTGLTYVTDSTNKTIPSQTSNVSVLVNVETVAGNPPLTIEDATHATFVTSLGNKFTTEVSILCS